MGTRDCRQGPSRSRALHHLPRELVCVTTRVRDRASGHADALAQTMYDLLVTDQQSVRETQQLLMWDDRDTPPVTAVGP